MAPPPTKFGQAVPQAPVQRRIASAGLPPPTKYGPAPVAQPRASTQANAVAKPPPPPAPRRPQGGALIQAKVPFSFGQWCQANNIDAAALGRKQKAKLLATYYQDYVRPEKERTDKTLGKIARGTAGPDNAVDAYWSAKEHAIDIEAFVDADKHGRKDLRQVDWMIHATDRLVTALNDAQSYVPKKYLEDTSGRYSRDGGWANEKEALEDLRQAVAASQLPAKPAGNGVNVPGMTWAQAQGRLKPSLTRLIDDIRKAHRLNIVLDERNRQQLADKDDAPDTPGSLRSWHWNEQRALPAINPMGHVSALHTHYQANSTGPFNGVGAHGGPIGYAEYTGTGIVDDKHNCKLVYDYVNDIMYVTVTHYQRYDLDANAGQLQQKYTVKSKTDGTHSAWFYVQF